MTAPPSVPELKQSETIQRSWRLEGLESTRAKNDPRLISGSGQQTDGHVDGKVQELSDTLSSSTYLLRRK